MKDKKLEKLGDAMVNGLEKTIEDLEFHSVDGKYTAKHIINVIGNALSGCIYGLSLGDENIDPARGLAITVMAIKLIATEDEDVKQAYDELLKEKIPNISLTDIYDDLEEEDEDEDEEGDEWKKL